MQALILADGLGTRLRSVVGDRPKCMAPIGNRPFLEYLIRMLHRQGCDEIILSTGYLANVILDHFKNGERIGVKLSYSHENTPLGTAGAIKLAERQVHEDDFFVANGDSILDVDLNRLLELHQNRSALVTIGLVEVKSASRYGTVELGHDGAVTRFAEKTGRAELSIINGGLYVCNRELPGRIPPGKRVSLESEILPVLIEGSSTERLRAANDRLADRELAGLPACEPPKGVYGMISQSYFIDIGLPEDYARVQAQPQELMRIAGVE